MKRVGKYLGLTSGVVSVLLWVGLCVVVLTSTSPSSDLEPIINTFISLCLPGCIAILASLTSMNFLMLIAFVWSLPISYYMAGTPGIFALFGATCAMYLISFLIMFFMKLRGIAVSRFNGAR
ncbi:hypothetical protein [Ornithinibacillus californiensis]|jgi:hypothetical protein|uniref:hypothetical protein n=1 Tax=Ornithinibacillus californiensis TaxID=161536 RepID=UPI00064DFEE8|nr:hypothetical protein [Ornithinibacillus californiensis]